MLFILPPLPSFSCHGARKEALSIVRYDDKHCGGGVFLLPPSDAHQAACFCCPLHGNETGRGETKLAAQYMDTHVLSPPNRPDVVPRRDGSINVSSV